tara:strand:- start:108 stop:1358 length:1251 start_codon:yes stop_codon:yes gene_type:complete
MDERFTIDDFQAEIAHTLRKPYLRVKGIELSKERTQKKFISSEAEFNSRRILNSVAYEVSEELVTDITNKILKGNQRQLITNFYHARLPHPEMFMAWKLKLDGLDEMFVGWAIDEIDGRRMMWSGKGFGNLENSVTAPSAYYRYTFYVGVEEPGSDRLLITHMPCCVANACWNEEKNPRPWEVYEKEFNTQAFIHEEIGGPVTYFDMFKRLLFRSELLQSQNTPSGLAFNLKFMDDPTLENSAVLRGSNVDEQQMFDFVTAMPGPVPYLNSNPAEGVNAFFQGLRNDVNIQAMIISWQMLVAFVAMRNYDWVIKEPIAREKGTKNVSTRTMPRNRHYKMAIKLPKEKQLMEGKQPERTRQFGTALHTVSGHYRTFRDENKKPIRRVWIAEHKRGDAKYGIVTKDYVLTKDENSDEE